MPSNKIGLHYPYTFDALQLEKMFKKPSYSVVGRNDMFARLRSLLKRIVDCLDCKWMQITQCLRMVCQIVVEW